MTAGARGRWRRTATAADLLESGLHYIAIIFPADDGHGLAARLIRDEVAVVGSTTALVRFAPASSGFVERSLYLSDRHVELILYADHGLDDGFQEISPCRGPVSCTKVAGSSSRCL